LEDLGRELGRKQHRNGALDSGLAVRGRKSLCMSPIQLADRHVMAVQIIEDPMSVGNDCGPIWAAGSSYADLISSRSLSYSSWWAI
jgi:hypothetical protein